MIDFITYYDIIRTSRKEVVSVVEDKKELLEIAATSLEIITMLLVIRAELRREIKELKKNRKRDRRKKRKR